MHRRSRRCPPVRRLQYERHRFEGRRPRVPAAVHAGKIDLPEDMIRMCKLTAGILTLAFLWMVPAATAQKAKPAAAKTPIFAVLGDGTSIEPIGYVDGRGRMTPAIDGASERKVLNAFHRT